MRSRVSPVVRSKASGLRQISTLPCLPALGSFLLAQLLAAAASAQCTASNPPPAPPTVVIPNVNGQSFGPSPKSDFLVDLRGEAGCGGGEGSPNGGPGSPAQGAASAALKMQNVTFTGASTGYVDPGSGQGVAAAFLASGGGGGEGGAADYNIGPGGGGDGGAAGAAGSLTGSLSGFTIATIPGQTLAYGLFVETIGGGGGLGGAAYGHGLAVINGGAGADGSAGGTIELTVGARIAAGKGAAAPRTAAAFVATGGGGGNGGPTTSNGNSTWGGHPGNGGAGATATVTTTGDTTIVASEVGLEVATDGGRGGDGGGAGSSPEVHGSYGGIGGNAGSANLTFDGAVSVSAIDSSSPAVSGLLVQSNGGAGGNGGLGGGALGGYGGAGGNGGAGGYAGLTLLGDVTATGVDPIGGLEPAGGQAVLVQGNGGPGGFGTQTNSWTGFGGNGGAAGNGHQVAVNLGVASASGPALVTSNGPGVDGVVAQSVGGGGGSGGAAQFYAAGGAGANGGDGAGVGVIANQVWTIVNGDEGRALVAQSIGGGGGMGGTATDLNVGAGYAVGGNGGAGGNGSWVELKLNGGSNNVFASMSEYGGSGVLAQSIAGSGGAGGNASEKGFGFFTMVVGGDSGTGGTADVVDVDSTAIVTTFGDQAAGILAQSIGGGGGVAGEALGIEGGGVLPTAAVAVGGRGGSGGVGGKVTIENAGQAITYGPDAPGLAAQSIGGGGGSGGSAAATAINVSPNEEIPAISASYATGGAGGSGNLGGEVDVTNSGFVVTAGHGSMGILAQSIGGGGGRAGDASAASWTGTTSDSQLSVNLSAAVGGSGGVGGASGQVGLENSGLVYTTGQDAYGVFAQSVGGGGGTGGVGDTAATVVQDDLSFAIGLAVGGRGGTGGTGGGVSLKNAAGGLIATRGDGSDGVFAQSVGGGGGTAGGGSASSNGGSISLAVALGGNGGAGGNGGDVSLENDGMITTIGTDAMGLTAQSVGGGGGRGGKAGATAGGADDDLPEFVFGQIQNAFSNPDAPSVQLVDKLWALNDRLKGDVETLNKLTEHFTGNAEKPADDDTIALSINAALSVGGSGGAAGKGGDITLTNTGALQTQGAQADGIVGQSVGGGGGIGGYSVASGASSDDTSPNFSLSLGGSGGGGGDGGAVTVTNSGAVSTAGTSAYGLVAQSVGAGGGRGGASQDTNNGALGFGLSLGGGGGSTGNGGKVDVELQANSTLQTTGKFGLGVLAQSVGGGGGLIRTMTTDQQGDQSGSGDDDAPDAHNIFLDMGVAGASGGNGSGGAVTVAMAKGAAIGTSGYKAHGVVATSLGGGGGAVGGGVINLIQASPHTGDSSGNGGAVTMSFTGARIETQGTGAVGVWGSSIGGTGGVLLGDLNQDAPLTPGGVSPGWGNVGNGGAVSITLDQSNVTTVDGPAIIAHSIAGSGYSAADGGDETPVGGWVSPMTATNVGGTGTSGVVTVQVTDSIVSTLDQSAIVVGSDASAAADIAPGATNPITVTVAKSQVPSTEVSNNSADHATVSYINNSGRDVLLTNSATIANLHAGGYVAASPFGGHLKVDNSGTLTGNVQGGDGASMLNRAGATFAPYDTVDLGGGRLRNAGTIEVGGIGRIKATTLSGALNQSGPGHLRFDLDAAGGKVDTLRVTGAATLAGAFDLVPTTLLPGTYAVLSADQGVTLDEKARAGTTQVFSFLPSLKSGQLALTAQADFSADGADTADRRAVARHLQAIWDKGGTGFAEGFGGLAAAKDAASYGRSLDSLAGQSVAAIGYTRFLGGDSVAQSTYSCPRFEEAGVYKTQDSCAWLKVRGSWLERSATGDDPAFDYNAVTTSVGGQWRLADDLFLGGTLGWEDGRLNDDANAVSVDGSALVGAASLKRVSGPWTFTGALDLGWGSYDSSRKIQAGSLTETATADPGALNAGIHGRAAYQIPQGSWYLEPALDVTLSYVRLDGYTESGAGDLGLVVDGTDTLVLSGTPWLKVGRRIDVENGGTLDAYLSGGVSLSTGEDFDTTAHFLNAPAGTGDFTTTLDNPNLIGRISAGVELLTTSHWDVRLQYDGSFADSQTENGGQIRLSYYF